MPGRRAKGEGTIRKRKDGSWEARYPLGTEAGKTRYRYHYAKTRKAAADWLAAQSATDAGPEAADRMTVTAFLDLWLHEVISPAKAPNTYHSYYDMVRMHIAPHIGPIRLDKLTPMRVQSWVNELAGVETIGPRTVRYAHAILRSALSYAQRVRLIAHNPAKGAALPKVPKYHATALTVAQAQQLLATVKGHRLSALYRLALGLGLRRGELIALRWADVNLEAATIRVAESKSEAGRRTLPLPASLVEALRQHWAKQAAERLRAGAAWHEHGLVFPSEAGTPLSGRNLLRHFYGALERAKLPQVRFHDLRHTVGSLLASDGVPLIVIRDILGHSQIGITADTYGHTYDGDKKKALDKLQEG